MDLQKIQEQYSQKDWQKIQDNFQKLQEQSLRAFEIFEIFEKSFTKEELKKIVECDESINAKIQDFLKNEDLDLLKVFYLSIKNQLPKNHLEIGKNYLRKEWGLPN